MSCFQLWNWLITKITKAIGNIKKYTSDLDFIKGFLLEVGAKDSLILE